MPAPARSGTDVRKWSGRASGCSERRQGEPHAAVLRAGAMHSTYEARPERTLSRARLSFGPRSGSGEMGNFAIALRRGTLLSQRINHDRAPQADGNCPDAEHGQQKEFEYCHRNLPRESKELYADGLSRHVRYITGGPVTLEWRRPPWNSGLRTIHPSSAAALATWQTESPPCSGVGAGRCVSASAMPP